MDLFLRVNFPQGGLYSTMLVNEVIDKISCVFILQGSFIYSSLVEKLLQIRIYILKVETMVRIPAYVANMLEVCW